MEKQSATLAQVGGFFTVFAIILEIIGAHMLGSGRTYDGVVTGTVEAASIARGVRGSPVYKVSYRYVVKDREYTSSAFADPKWYMPTDQGLFVHGLAPGAAVQVFYDLNEPKFAVICLDEPWFIPDTWTRRILLCLLLVAAWLPAFLQYRSKR